MSTDAKNRWLPIGWWVLIGAVVMGAGAFVAIRYRDGQRPLAWEPFSLERVEQTLSEGRPTVVDFMANWNATTAINSKIIESPRFRRMVRQKNVATIRADWTDGNDAISEELKRLNVNSIPLVVFYLPDRSPIVLKSEQLMDDRAVVNVLRQIRVRD